MPPALTPSDLQRLHQTYADGLFRYFWAATGHPSDSEDLVQEFFIKLAKTATDLQSLTNEKAWIFTIARHLTLDWHRAQSRRPTSRTTDRETLANLPLESTSDPDAAFFARELLTALHELPAPQRIVAQMKLWEGLTLREIAESQDIPIQTAASRLRYAIDRLRQRLRHLYTELQ